MLVKVIVVDPYQLVRRGITSILSGDPDIEICGEASDGKETMALIESMQPDVCIMNNRINQQNGLDVIEKLKHAGAACKFVYLTSSLHPSELSKALSIGVEGLLLKEALPEELLYAIRHVGRGRRYYDFELLESKLMEKTADNEYDLTPKEQEVLAMLSEGLSNREIASRLIVTEYTVKKHVSQILSKLNLPDRTKAALYFHSHNVQASQKLFAGSV
ncbi:DNA-binding response regulator [Paenibacillus sp. PK3_47]|uniref:response regulator n=1 Tax=Paenibacillus sp. PK3_47 TaxID=2072642 RepID=UPI00201E5CBF|nr:response regulator transcription factor [Paenibacillus sp. PK3_47]UQZ33156.1 DNA-binding response regulator [Paenibacillus sp. PK3_47]